jgi:hypothetical protein
MHVLALRFNLPIVLYHIVSLKNLTVASISSSVLWGKFKVNLLLMSLKSSKFVCLLLDLGGFSWFSVRVVSVMETGD